MRLKKMIKKAVDTVVNPEEAKKLSQWKKQGLRMSQSSSL